jgi:hypothetical protein
VSESTDFPGDMNGRTVSRWSTTMHNLGFAVFEDEMVKMLELGVWRDFHDALGHWRFLPGEFDYFLSSVNIERDHVLHGVRDLDVRARVQDSMDQRRTGEAGYRRTFEEVRASNPHPAAGSLQPYGYKLAERHMLEAAGVEVSAKQREPLGSAVREYVRSGRTTRPRPYASPLDQLKRRSLRLGDDDLNDLVEHVLAEQRRRASNR